jgi:GMP synthase-like glutamine amidotransferase
MPAMRKHTIAVLECDTPVPPVLSKLGTYGDIFEAFLRHGLDKYRRESGAGEVELRVIKSNMVDMGPLPSPDEIDSVILTGSKHNAFEDQPWMIRLVDYVRDLYKTTSKPIVGICFGHQIIARALDAPVERNSVGWEVAVDQINLTPEGQKLFGVDKLALHQMHRDIVVDVPEDAINLGHSPVCQVQGLYIPQRVLSVQAHPEFTGFIMQGILNTRREQGVFDDALFNSGWSRAEKDHDGIMVSAVIWKFLLNDDL